MARIREKQGFTLIELLVVVGIVGLLAAVVLVSLGRAKKEGNDAAVKTNLHTVVNQAELFYSDHNSYLPAGGSAIAVTSPCPTYISGGTNMFTNNKTLADALAEAVSVGDGSACYNSANAWAVAVGLESNVNTSWCIDNSGAARAVNSAPGSAINPLTFVCN